MFPTTFLFLCHFYLVNNQLQDEGGNAAVDTDEEVDGGQNDISRAGDGEHKRCWIHQRGDGPPEKSDYQVILLLKTDADGDRWSKCHDSGCEL